MEPEEVGQDCRALLLVADLLELDVAEVGELPQPAPDVRPVRRAERREERVPGMTREPHERADVGLLARQPPAPAGQQRRQPRRAATVRAELPQVEAHARAFHMCRQRLERRAVRAAAYDHVEVVRADGPRPEQLEPGRKHDGQPRAERERRQRQQLAAVARGQQVQAAAPSQVRPPRVQPLPRLEHARAVARRDEVVPFLAEREEGVRVVDQLDLHGVSSGASGREGEPQPQNLVGHSVDLFGRHVLMDRQLQDAPPQEADVGEGRRIRLRIALVPERHRFEPALGEPASGVHLVGDQ